ncbi:MAG: hypothetical protein R2747_03935 [Pyrinomonadaceae bacterium]
MKKFKFTLQTVHNVREMRQEKEHLRLTELQNELNQAQARIVEIERQQQIALEKYSERLKKGESINAYELELDSLHLTELDRLKRDALEILEQKKKDCEKQTETVAAATRAVKITNRLRENQAERHKLETERIEQNQIDELVSANFARLMSETK